MSRRIIARAALLVTCLATLDATAQPRAPAPATGAGAARPKTVREELPEAARRDWDAARELFDAKDYQGALVEYLRAYQISKNPRVLYNVAVAEKSLGHYARAIARFNQMLERSAGSLSPQDERDVRDAITALRPFVSTVKVTVNEPGATLFMDALEVEGQSPFVNPIVIDVGKRTLRVHKDGFRDATLTLDIAGGVPAEPPPFRLEPLVRKGIVSVQVTGAPAATVVIDGVDMGPAPYRGEIAAGRHTFEARAQGYVLVRQTSEIGHRESVNLVLTLAEERHEGRVRIEAQPEGSIIEIDGKVVGSTTWEGVLPSGGHQLIVKKSGHEAYSSDIAVADDQARNVKVTLFAERRRTDWIFWTIGTLAVVGGGAIASYFVFKTDKQPPVEGTFQTPGFAPTHVHW